MKKIILLAVIAASVTACKKNTSFVNSGLVGKWKLSESFFDPGDGSGKWQKADPSHPVYVEFGGDGRLTISPYNMYNPDHYEVTSDTTMIYKTASENSFMRYHFSETLLTIFPQCYEACSLRYIPVP